MAWVKLDDKVMTHPRIFNLSDKSFRLWIWGLCYSQQHLTDGAIPAGLIPPRLKRSTPDLVSRGLWTDAADGFAIRDFLQWNDSKALVEQKREAAKQRMRGHRSREHIGEHLREVPVRCGSSEALTGKESEGNHGSDLAARAGRLREELYPAWYAKYRHGARLRLVANSLDFQDAMSLVSTWDDDRIEKLARIILTTDDEFVSKTDRGFHIFAIKATWADDRLRQLEAAQKVSA